MTKFAVLNDLSEGDELIYVGGGGYQNADIPDLTKGKIYPVIYETQGSWRHAGRWCIFDDAEPDMPHYLSVYDRNGELWGWMKSSHVESPTQEKTATPKDGG